MEPRRPEDLLAHDAFIRRLALLLVRNVHEAEDVVQETFAAAIARPAISAAPLRSWLATVVRNCARQMRRATGRRLARELLAAQHERMLSTSEIVERESARKAVLDTVLALPEPCRAAVLARFYEDLPNRAAARKLGVPIDTYRSQLKRGLALLRERLDRHYQGDTNRWFQALLPFAALSHVQRKEATMSLAIRCALLTIVLGAGGASVWRTWHVVPSNAQQEPVVAPPREANATRRAGEPGRSLVAGARSDIGGEEQRSHVGGPATGTVIVHVQSADGTPLAGIGVSVQPSFAPQQGVCRRDGVTGADGAVSVENVMPGINEVSVSPDMAGGEVNVEAGETQERTFHLREGLFVVEGLVVDDQERPVEGALIWHGGSAFASGVAGLIVGRSAADGSFRIAAANSVDLVAARATGHSPSNAVYVEKNIGRAGEPVPVKLVLPGPGGALHGHVGQPDGTPVPNAIVEVGNPVGDAGAWMRTPPPLQVSCDASGAFEVQGLAPGSITVRAGAPGFAVITTSATIVAGATQSMQVTLTTGATIHGHVTMSSGQPLPALVYAHVLDSLGASVVHANVAGEFVLEHVAAGTVPLSAQDAETYGMVEATVSVHEGESVEWNPVLPAGIVISGQLLDDRDTPLANWHTTAVRVTPPYALCTARTDVQGRFTIRGLTMNEHTVTVSGDDTRHLAPWLIVEHVLPGHDCVLRFPDAARPTATIKGTLLTHDLEPPGTFATTVHVQVKTFPVDTLRPDADTGEFATGLLSPNTYRIFAWIKGCESKDLGEFTVGANQTLDLGEIVLEKGGS